MEFYSFVVEFFREGGVFLYPLALVFAVGLAIAVERYFVLTKTSLVNRLVWDKITPSLKAGNLTEAMKIAERSHSALGTVLCYGLSRARVTYRRDDIEKAMEESLLEIIPRLDKRTHYLSSLANIGMLMGLLGTVIGLISAFGAISTAHVVSAVPRGRQPPPVHAYPSGHSVSVWQACTRRRESRQPPAEIAAATTAMQSISARRFIGTPGSATRRRRPDEPRGRPS